MSWCESARVSVCVVGRWRGGVRGGESAGWMGGGCTWVGIEMCEQYYDYVMTN